MSAITYVKYSLYIIVVVAFIGFLTDYILVKKEISKKDAQILILSDAIKSQNEAIEALELDISKYKQQKEKVVEKIVEKYKTIKVKDETCEAYLETIYEAQQSFFNRNEYKRIK